MWVRTGWRGLSRASRVDRACCNLGTPEGTVNTPPRTMGAMDAQHHRSRPFPEAPPAQRAANDLRLAALMQAAQDGDRIAYAGLLRELVPLLQRMMRRRLGLLLPSVS